ncbi:hypothetical protein AS180_17880 [Priestia veravalensis]|uniref:Uncharacterized protein n=1 Tax=Priestia veravalensis TaxID=1414648 RepID=A0A0V8JHT2_9BACI|nr:MULTISPECIES: hypothetical protein [Priestia]KSU86559.1 hypothetical protein AS180_17880 [Priestia veravalensis]SCC50673.1 hypothetical protein GA0061087_10667 [Priestia flexa]
MIEGKGLGNKKINRVNVSLSNRTNRKLNQLATACNTKPTTLAGLFIEICLNDSQIVHKLQEEYNIYTPYKVIPVQNNGEIDYIFKG